MKSSRQLLFSFFIVLSLCTVCWAQQPELVVETGHSKFINSVAFSADGKTLASGSSDQTIKLWEVATGRELRTLAGHSGGVNSVAFSADGKTLASGSSDNMIKLWEVATGRELRTITGHSDYVCSVAFSADGKMLASGGFDNMIKLWEVATGRELRTLAGHSRYVNSVAFSADGKTLASGSDNMIKLWEVATGRELRTLAGHRSYVSRIAFSADGKTLASDGDQNTIKLWDVTTGRVLRTLTGHSKWVDALAFSSDGKTLASGSGDATIKLWDVATGRKLRTLTGHSDYVTSVSFSADAKTLASVSVDNTIKLWEVSTGRELRTLTGHSSSVNSVAFSPDGKTLATNGDKNTIKMWEIATGFELRTLTGHASTVNSVALSLDGKTLASGGSDNVIKLWEVATGRELRTLTGHGFPVNSVAFSGDGKTLASGSVDDTIKLWEVATGRELHTFAGHSQAVESVAVSPDGKMLASCASDNKVKVWDVATGHELRTLTGHANSVLSSILSVAFSADGKTLASGSTDKTIKLWEVATGRVLRTLTGHSEAVQSVAFSADGKTLASGSRDNTIKLWEVVTGRELRTLTGHSALVESVAFSGDGKFLVSGSEDATTKLWRVDNGELLASLIALDEADWAVVTPDGRFDTNNLEEIKNLHWLFADDSLKAIPPEIFMRQYYEPRLLTRLLQNKSFDPVPPLASLNRVQPEVKIRSIVPAADSTRSVKLTVDVANSSGVQLRGGTKVMLQSGVYDLRLFRDGQLVSYVPGKIQLDSAGKATIEREVKLPGRTDLKEVEFTAYAFNSDQVKSATSNYTYKPAEALPAVKGRAYIISVGVNAYEDPAWDLSFAARDARVSEETLTQKLAASGAYDVVPLRLTSDYQKTDSGRVETTKLATRKNFQTVLELLAYGPEKVDAKLLEQIPGADKLRKAEPEDLVLISFSSHGYTDKHGKFYLVPYDTGVKIEFSRDGQEIAAESLAHFISSDDLSEWVRDIDAGELVMIIDTCHSAGAIEEPGFKPGPMGSRGMGQLAYDKGIRVLAASQADDVALEIGKLQQGLLTYALMQEGLGQGRADKNSDGRITLDEWLGYGAERVPTLYDDVKAGRVEALKSKDLQITAVLSGASVKKSAFQQPQLFDFKRKKRDVLLASTKTS